MMSQPSWAAWIEIFTTVLYHIGDMSQPSWAAWIEMWTEPSGIWHVPVAALLGCVD